MWLAALSLAADGSVRSRAESVAEITLPLYMVAPPQSDSGDWGGCSFEVAAPNTAFKLCASLGGSLFCVNVSAHVDHLPLNWPSARACRLAINRPVVRQLRGQQKSRVRRFCPGRFLWRSAAIARRSAARARQACLVRARPSKARATLVRISKHTTRSAPRSPREACFHRFSPLRLYCRGASISRNRHAAPP